MGASKDTPAVRTRLDEKTRRLIFKVIRVLNGKIRAHPEGRPIIYGPKVNYVMFVRASPKPGFKVAVNAFFKTLHRKFHLVYAALLLGALHTEKYYNSYDASREDYLYSENGGLTIGDARSETMLSFLGYKKGAAVHYADNKLVNKILDVLFAIVPGLHRWMEDSGYSKSDFANVSISHMFDVTREQLHAIERAI